MISPPSYKFITGIYLFSAAIFFIVAAVFLFESKWFFACMEIFAMLCLLVSAWLSHNTPDVKS